MYGINHAAHDFYDLHPLAGKEFSSDEVLRLFHQFENIVTRDPFWEKKDNLKDLETKIKTLSTAFSESIIPAVDAAI